MGWNIFGLSAHPRILDELYHDGIDRNEISPADLYIPNFHPD